MDLLIRILFINKTSKTEYTIITKGSTAKMISEWYASHHEGDDFVILINGRKQEQDVNGALAADPTP